MDAVKYLYVTRVLAPKGLRVSGDDHTAVLAQSLESVSNELGADGWKLVAVTPTLSSGGSASKLLLTFRKKAGDVQAEEP